MLFFFHCSRYSAWSVLEAPRISALLAILGDRNGTDGYFSLKSLEVSGGITPVHIQCSNWQVRFSMRFILPS
jgi:hypothetical protein